MRSTERISQKELLEKAMMFDLVLASASPRRQELLAGLGWPFKIVVPKVIEKQLAGEKPAAYVQRNAQLKAQWVKEHGPSADNKPRLIIAGDTIVVCQDSILEKPVDHSDATRMLKLLSGRSHRVLSGVALLADNRDQARCFVVETLVTFKTLHDDEIQAYIATGEPFDKAGSYGMQSAGAFMVQAIEGSCSNVIGLPMAELTDALASEYSLRIGGTTT